jgi:uncharacterized small protein (DUF1192 family)
MLPVDTTTAPRDHPGMEADEPRAARDASLAALSREDLDPLSIAECAERIAALEAEIRRTRDRMDKAAKIQSSADSIFRR